MYNELCLAVWVCDEPREFKCARTGKCITQEQRCDGTLNCGDFDDSDETDCGEYISNIWHSLDVLVPCSYST